MRICFEATYAFDSLYLDDLFDMNQHAHLLRIYSCHDSCSMNRRTPLLAMLHEDTAAVLVVLPADYLLRGCRELVLGRRVIDAVVRRRVRVSPYGAVLSVGMSVPVPVPVVGARGADGSSPEALVVALHLLVEARRVPETHRVSELLGAFLLQVGEGSRWRVQVIEVPVRCGSAAAALDVRRLGVLRSRRGGGGGGGVRILGG